jgi:electron transfer flavoprotein alpha subunit
MTVLVIAEHDNVSLKSATLNVVMAATQTSKFTDGLVHVLIMGHKAESVVLAAAQITGVAKVIYVDGTQFAHGLAENVAAQVLTIAGQYSHVMFPSTASGKNVAPRLAAKLDVAQISDVTKIESSDTFERPIYAGNAIATVQSTDAIKVLTVRTTGFDAAIATGGAATVDSVAAVAGSRNTTFVGSEIARNDRPELTAAKVIVSGGRALGSNEKFMEIMTPQTGKIVAPQLYIAVGISGAIQHLAGMKDSKVIVAINMDADAPIFSVADYGLVADLFVAVPELVSAL